AQTAEPCLSCVHREVHATCVGDDVDEAQHVVVAVVIVHPNAMLHGHRDVGGEHHRFDALGDGFGLEHQACSKPTVLDAIAGATHVDVDLVVAPIGCDACTLRHLCGGVAAHLEREWVFDGVV